MKSSSLTYSKRRMCVVATTSLLASVFAFGDVNVIDYRDIAQHLVQRHSLSTAGIVDYREYRFRTDAASFDHLAQILLESQDAPASGLKSQIESWISEQIPMAREAWAGRCAFMTEAWLDNKHRIEGIDTVRETYAARAAEVGAGAMPTVQQVARQVEGMIETTVEDGKVVIERNVPAMANPLMPVDCSLATWQDAIDLGANVPGQQLLGREDGDHKIIEYRNNHDDGSWSIMSYVFRTDLEWGPSEIRSYDETGTDMRMVYGYIPISSSDTLTRPVVAAKAEIRQDGQVDVIVWIVDRWQDSCAPSDVSLRPPPLYLEISFLQSEDTPEVSVREPTYLQQANGCDKSSVAIANIAMMFGTSDPETDFNYDGFVDFEDMDTAYLMINGHVN